MQENGIRLLLVLGEVSYGLDVAVFEVLLLELGKHNVLFTELSVADHEHFKVFFNLLRSLGLNFSGNRINISEVMLPDPFDKRLILLQRPLEEAGLCELTELLLVLLGHDLVVILSMLNLLAEGLKLLEVVIELELIDFGDLDGAVLLGHGLFLFTLTLLRLFL